MSRALNASQASRPALFSTDPLIHLERFLCQSFCRRVIRSAILSCAKLKQASAILFWRPILVAISSEWLSACAALANSFAAAPQLLILRRDRQAFLIVLFLGEFDRLAFRQFRLLPLVSQQVNMRKVAVGGCCAQPVASGSAERQSNPVHLFRLR